MSIDSGIERDIFPFLPFAPSSVSELCVIHHRHINRRDHPIHDIFCTLSR